MCLRTHGKSAHPGIFRLAILICRTGYCRNVLPHASCNAEFCPRESLAPQRPWHHFHALYYVLYSDICAHCQEKISGELVRLLEALQEAFPQQENSEVTLDEIALRFR
jgi:hypothetical protein